MITTTKMWRRSAVLSALLPLVLLVASAMAQGNSPEMTARGKQLFFEGVIGVGCAACHGEDARGLIGQDIRGKAAADIKTAANTVEDMLAVGINTLSDDDFAAVSAYLGTLVE